MSNIKLHASTVWTLRTKKKLLEKIKNGEEEQEKSIHDQSTTVCQFKRKVIQLLTA